MGKVHDHTGILAEKVNKRWSLILMLIRNYPDLNIKLDDIYGNRPFEEALENFKSERSRFLFLTYNSCSGLNLTKANHVVFLDPDWMCKYLSLTLPLTFQCPTSNKPLIGPNGFPKPKWFRPTTSNILRDG